MKFFIPALLFFTAMIFILAFTIFLYIKLVIAVKKNRDVPSWMYRIGHAIRGRGGDIFDNFTDKSALKEVNFYIIGIVIASIAAYFIFYGRYYSSNDVAFWLWTEFFIIAGMRVVIALAKMLLIFIFPMIRKQKYSYSCSAAANAVTGMFLISIFACVLALNMTGLPVKAPVVKVEGQEIVVGSTTAEELISNGFTFKGKNSGDIIENKRRGSNFFFSNKVELLKDGKECGYVDLTPTYKDRDRLEDCIVTYFGTSSDSGMFDDIKICDKDISKLSTAYFEKENMRDAFSLSPISYEEYMGDGHYSLVMQTYPYMLWKKYKIEIMLFDNNKPGQFEVYAYHTIWE
ncbi:hypothetical protein [Baileyella intestinalis]|uniref:hypothetical protein n=1 Tax=Baileyella intestinalis TaxID=2606709 RepID=UPI0022E58C20|nr:hypothetical protein [Baileyella intestinalis]